ncbi:hypothetical protein [Agromyces binzhouensis]|uniref:hypothetical protein n=1 Tax=Agromyces binzhouensis TaxID=1817495 RepID=UPI00362949B2
MHPQLPYGTRLIGQTEKTLNAILERLLEGSGIGEREWVALTVLLQSAPAGRAASSARVASALRVEPRGVDALLDALAERGLLAEAAGSLSVTDAGRELHSRIRRRAEEIVGRLWGDISAEDRETAASVLNRTLRRATDELTALAG